MHACALVKYLSKIRPLSQNRSNVSFILPFWFCFPNTLLSARRMSFFKTMKQDDKQLLFFESKICPIMLRNMLGQVFDSTLDRFLAQPFRSFVGHFPFQNMLKPLRSAKHCILAPLPQSRNTICEHNCANWKTFVIFFLHFFLVFFCCPFIRRFFFEQRKNKKKRFKTKQQKKGNMTTRCNSQHHLVLLQKRKPRQHRHKTETYLLLKWKQTNKKKE